MPAIEAKPVVGVDWLELNAFGEWDHESWLSTIGLPYGEQSLHEQLVQVKSGGRHGQDFYLRSVQQELQFRIDVYHFHQQYSGPQYAARVYLFSRLLNDRGPIEAFRWIVEYTSRLGLKWKREQLSRLDLRADVPVPFVEFSERIEKGFWISHAKRNTDLESTYPTSRYFGKSSKHGKSNGNVRLRIYDKEKEMQDKQQPHIAGPWTRIEFQLHRHWFKKKNIEGLGTVRFSGLWPSLTHDFFRIVDRVPDKKHPERSKTWDVWEAIQQAQIPCDGFLPRKGPRPINPHPKI